MIYFKTVNEKHLDKVNPSALYGYYTAYENNLKGGVIWRKNKK